MDEVIKALGPWPLLQLVFGMVVLGLGVYSIFRGLYGKEHQNPRQLEDRRLQWEAQRQLENIEQNTFKMVELLQRNNELNKEIIETLNRWGSFFFNKGQL